MATANIAAQLLSDLKRDFGLTNEQAAGVVGNLMHESGGFNSLQEVNPSSGRGGFGYAQWTGDRRNAFENFAARNGLDPSSYEANYGYLKHEIETDPYERRQFNTVKNAKTAAEAARLVSENFLRPGSPNIASRQNYANQALGYAGSPVPPSNIPSPPGSSVASQLSVTPPRLPPAPATVEDRVTARNTAPPILSPLQTALNAEAARRSTVIGNTVTPASAEDRVTARNRAPMVPSPFGDDPGTRANGPVVATIPSRSAFNGDPGTRSNGPVVATIPSRPPTSLPRLTVPGSDGSYAGQTERMPAARFNGDPLTPSNGPVVASFPTAGPTTRAVPTTRVGNSGNNIMQARNEQAIQRQVVPPAIRPVPSPAPPIRTASDIASIYAQGGPTRPAAPIIPDRLTPSPIGLPAKYGTMAPAQVAQIGLPSLAPPMIVPRFNPVSQVATQLAVSQPRVAPVPLQRPMQQPMRIPARTAPPMNILGSGNPLRIVVNGGNTQPSNAFQGSNTGRTYTPGQVLQTANGPVVANEGGGFTNQATGQVSGHTVSGGLRYDPNGGPSGSGGFVRAR